MKSLRQIWKFITTDEKPPKKTYTKNVQSRRYTRITDYERNQVRKLYKSGMLQNDISRKVGIAPSSVSKILHKPKKKGYSVGEMPSNTKIVYERHQKNIRDGRTQFLPNHHLCPVCNPNSTLSWKEYFKMTHRATVSNARDCLDKSFTLSNN